MCSCIRRDFINASTEQTYVSIRMHYRDGSEAVLPMRTQHEVPGGTDQDRPRYPSVGCSATFWRVSGGLQQASFSNPRLSNPHPERMITGIDLEVGKGFGEPIFFAITANL